jgi:hypothetical protein
LAPALSSCFVLFSDITPSPDWSGYSKSGAFQKPNSEPSETTVYFCGALVSVHVARLAGDEGFVRLNNAGHLVSAAVIHDTWHTEFGGA